MEFIGHLWMPILLASVFCFILSALFWAVSPHHKGEWKEAPNAKGLQDFLRQAGAKPGAYVFPHLGDEERKDKEKAAAKMKLWAEGPSGALFIVTPGPMSMGAMMGKQFFFFLVVNLLLADIGHHIMTPVSRYLYVFKVIGSIAFMTYALGSIPESIWFGRPWKSAVLQAFDSLLYAGVTAGTFGWLWNR
jgi:hypothetical protein